MAEYGIIENGVIANVVVADANFAAANLPGAVRIDTLSPVPGIGWKRAGNGFEPANGPSAPPTPSTVFSKFGFRALFTLAELVAIDGYAANEALTSDQKATLNTITKNFEVADEIDLADPATQYGIGYLVSCGLLTQGRATRILAGLGPE